MTLFQDAFAGSNGDLLNGRTGWTKIGPGATDNPLLDGLGGLKTGGVDPSDSAVYGQDVGSADHFVRIKWTANAEQSGGVQGICVRVTDRNEHVVAFHDGSVWRIFSPGEGSLTSGAGGTGQSPADDPDVMLTAEGTTYKLYVADMVNALLSVTYSNATIDTPTIVGIMARSTAAENPLFKGPYYSGLIADIASIPSGGGGGSNFCRITGNRFSLAGPGGLVG